jgi:acyl-CoA synthetase (NDP forming)
VEEQKAESSGRRPTTMLSKMIEQMKKERRSHLTEIEAKTLLKAAGIPVTETKLARNEKEAVSISEEMGFPTALKIISSEITHKSDAGGVKLGLRNATQVAEAYRDMMASVRKMFPQAKIEGVSVQRMASPGLEVIIGMSKDPQFGPLLMFGLGGVLVEVLKDVSFRIVPVTGRDAKEMIAGIKGYPLLKGYRGLEPVDIAFLEELIVKVSDFVEKNPKLAEIDLNPIFAYRQGAVAVDARVRIDVDGEGHND